MGEPGEGRAVGKRGPAFYDDDVLFAAYMASRRCSDNPNDALEQPVMLELAGDGAGRRISASSALPRAW